jgi:hypothetical protein
MVGVYGSDMSNTQYLKKRGGAWEAVVEVPKPLRAVLKRPRFTKGLGTSSLSEANRLKLPLVAEWKRQIANVEKLKADPNVAVIAAALAFRAALDARDKHTMINRDHETTNEDQLLDVVRDEAKEVLDRHAANVLPVIRAAQKAGATTLREIADALNARGVHTARGGKWFATSVKNILDRAQAG